MTKKDNSEKSFWQKVGSFFKGIFNWLVRYPIALVIAVLVVLVAVILMVLGAGDAVNIGGILGKLFGKDDSSDDRVEVANKVPEGRDLPKEEEDEHGWKQKEVKPLDKSKNPLRDKSKIEIRDPETGEKKKLKLPKGVEDKDVDRVLQVKPKLYKVKVKDEPKGVVITEEDLQKFS